MMRQMSLCPARRRAIGTQRQELSVTACAAPGNSSGREGCKESKPTPPAVKVAKKANAKENRVKESPFREASKRTSEGEAMRMALMMEDPAEGKPEDQAVVRGEEEKETALTTGQTKKRVGRGDDKSYEPLWKRNLCRSYKNTGECSYGNDCKYSHDNRARGRKGKGRKGNKSDSEDEEANVTIKRVNVAPGRKGRRQEKEFSDDDYYGL